MTINNVLVTGGGGYVGAVLIPKLLEHGYSVRVLDLFIYGEQVFDNVKENPNLALYKGDIRDQSLLRKILPGCDAVIHLACISNDPSFELDPELGKSINFDAFVQIVIWKGLAENVSVCPPVYFVACGVVFQGLLKFGHVTAWYGEVYVDC